ncbi:hypothetical protein PFISCL1PPCAC_20144 [Pristionchus fissidentatus]|uniref:Peptidase M14 domain-containing protein n=1 Tax=Pristionchus fissidentatus TaxID=1538716 RepID=A0AAV5WCU7_9BILA|nr:hypothetical protein PFISCL1PPCAC_20144 [Pristionchus fissidentatus]
MSTSPLLTLLFVSIFSFVQSISKYRVLSIVPRDEFQLHKLRSLREKFPQDFSDFWLPPSSVNGSTHVMASPGSNLERLLHKWNISYDTMLDDVEKDLISNSLLFKKREIALNGTRLKDDLSVPFGGLPLGVYHGYTAISDSLQRMADSSKGLAKYITIGTTVEGRTIAGLKIGHDDGKKEVFIFDAGIHAREWATVHTALYFINQLLNPAADASVKEYLDKMVIYIIPVANPDGYEYTRIDETNPKFRMWRKNRGRELCSNSVDGEKRCCKGVDLNRNFDFQFGAIGSSRYICSEIYHGPFAFSEPESIALRDLFMSLKGRIRAYITLHAYSQLFIHSYSHRAKAYPREIDDIRQVASHAVKEIEKMYGTKYQFGTGPEIIYGFAGGSTDWATEKIGVKYSYTIELRPLYTAFNGFVMRPSELIPTARETWNGVRVVMDAVLRELPTPLPPSLCVDTQPGCIAWIAASPSLCQTNPASMRRDCAKSCQFC